MRSLLSVNYTISCEYDYLDGNMDKEQWGTLSIYDHRTSLILESLVLFDRLVIPIPPTPIHDLTEEELDKLSADVDYLQKNDAAIAHEWDSNKFQEWQTDQIREALCVSKRDSVYDTRLMLREYTPDNIIATPVYGAREGYNCSLQDIALCPEQLLNIELTQKLSVPENNVAYSDIIALRNKPGFQSSMKALRKWRSSVLPELANDPTVGADAAGRDLVRLISKYEEEFEGSKVKKREACVISILALGAASVAMPNDPSSWLAVLAATAPTLYSIRDSQKPFWKEIDDKEFAAAGVIIESNQFFREYV